MTVAIAVKVFDGIVLASDSATTLSLQGGGHQVYNNAHKVFHLHRDLPVGAMTWGLANVGSASISTLTKDLRRRLMGKDHNFPEWELDKEGFTLELVANRLVELMHGELYKHEFDGVADPPVLGFFVAGYSGGEKQAEGWLVEISDAATAPVPKQVIDKGSSGWIAFAQHEAVSRLFNGYDPLLPDAAIAVAGPASAADLAKLFISARREPAVPPMPFTDAIKLAEFMVDVTVGYNRYLLGPDSVGGPVELAGISRHEGFKWIAREHYYPSHLNPGSPHSHDG